MLSRTAQRICTCGRSISYVRPAVALAPRFSGARLNSSDAASSSSALPWFVDPSTAPSAPSSSSSSASSPQLATAPVPTQPPSHIPESLHALHSHLSVSPFLDKESITYINSREADPDSWTDWIIIGTLRQGRERGLKGAIEGVRSYLASNPIDLSPAPAPTPFSPPSSSPLITGLPTPPSKHARSRAKGASHSRTESASGWAMLDTGRVVVHVMTSEARANWGIEEMWRNIERQGNMGARQEGETNEEYEELTEAEMETIRRREQIEPTT